MSSSNTDSDDPSSENPKEVLIRGKSGWNSDEVEVVDSPPRKTKDSTEAPPRPVPVAPNGVLLINDVDEHVTLAGVKKLLRPPRYFDGIADAGATFKCFNCGQQGHTARQCTRQARDKPCYLCAQFGHDGRTCQNRLCYQCGKTGHIVKDCPLGAAECVSAVCRKCGTSACPCAGKGDYFRYEGGCTTPYSKTDLQHVRCMSCGAYGHLCCAPFPKVASTPSCYNCGGGHYGEDCPDDHRPHLFSERSAGGRAADRLYMEQLEMQSHQGPASWQSPNRQRGPSMQSRDGGRPMEPFDRRSSAPLPAPHYRGPPLMNYNGSAGPPPPLFGGATMYPHHNGQGVGGRGGYDSNAGGGHRRGKSMGASDAWQHDNRDQQWANNNSGQRGKPLARQRDWPEPDRGNWQRDRKSSRW